ncbi:46489_t:CDS:1, partial [Gigaspora margarita]
INTKLKFQLWLEKAAELGAHIISMIETKLPESTTPAHLCPIHSILFSWPTTTRVQEQLEKRVLEQQLPYTQASNHISTQSNKYQALPYS